MANIQEQRRPASGRRHLVDFFSSSSEGSPRFIVFLTSTSADSSGVYPGSTASSGADISSIYSLEDEGILELPILDPNEETYNSDPTPSVSEPSSPLPDLIIEYEPENSHDNPPEFYKWLKQYVKKLLQKKYPNWSPTSSEGSPRSIVFLVSTSADSSGVYPGSTASSGADISSIYSLEDEGILELPILDPNEETYNSDPTPSVSEPSSPLPDLIIEYEPENSHDNPPEFYKWLKQYVKKLLQKKYPNWSPRSDCERPGHDFIIENSNVGATSCYPAQHRTHTQANTIDVQIQTDGNDTDNYVQEDAGASNLNDIVLESSPIINQAETRTSDPSKEVLCPKSPIISQPVLSQKRVSSEKSKTRRVCEQYISSRKRLDFDRETSDASISERESLFQSSQVFNSQVGVEGNRASSEGSPRSIVFLVSTSADSSGVYPGSTASSGADISFHSSSPIINQAETRTSDPSKEVLCPKSPIISQPVLSQKRVSSEKSKTRRVCEQYISSRRPIRIRRSLDNTASEDQHETLVLELESNASKNKDNAELHGSEKSKRNLDTIEIISRDMQDQTKTRSETSDASISERESLIQSSQVFNSQVGVEGNRASTPDCRDRITITTNAEVHRAPSSSSPHQPEASSEHAERTPKKSKTRRVCEQYISSRKRLDFDRETSDASISERESLFQSSQVFNSQVGVEGNRASSEGSPRSIVFLVSTSADSSGVYPGSTASSGADISFHSSSPIINQAETRTSDPSKEVLCPKSPIISQPVLSQKRVSSEKSKTRRVCEQYISSRRPIRIRQKIWIRRSLDNTASEDQHETLVLELESNASKNKDNAELHGSEKSKRNLDTIEIISRDMQDQTKTRSETSDASISERESLIQSSQVFNSQVGVEGNRASGRRVIPPARALIRVSGQYAREARGVEVRDTEGINEGINGVNGGTNGCVSDEREGAGSCYVLREGARTWVWCAATATGDEREVAKNMAAAEHVLVMQGKEKPEFWSALGSRRALLVAAPLQQVPRPLPPRLFYVSLGPHPHYYFEEIVSFTQYDLAPEMAGVVDAHGVVFVWLGAHAPPRARDEPRALALAYLAQDPAGRDPETPVITIAQGREPPHFTGFFPHWKQNMWKGHKTFGAIVSALEGKAIVQSGNSAIQSGNTANRFDQYEKYPLSVLRGPKDHLPPDVDPLIKELYLTHDDFVATFGLPYTEFRSHPAWKQKDMKKAVGLF